MKADALESDAPKLGRLKCPHHHMREQDRQGVGAGPEQGKLSFLTSDNKMPGGSAKRHLKERPWEKSAKLALRQLRTRLGVG